MAKDSQMVLSMSDATGFNTGGSTNVLTVKASQGGSCNSTDPGKSCKSISTTRSDTSLIFLRSFLFVSAEHGTATMQASSPQIFEASWI
jgi:hypothetical protein